ncbi:Uncharacterized protein APZ42_033511 [Daphnia magna]|uniref:Uncharacterized protein n=1 Tax=Daphnia magna TaxID=35525 RepID=A0A164L2H6_9CRUS|nr:Uncharacterized protein APZ42_033511 [Daphnia magna]
MKLSSQTKKLWSVCVDLPHCSRMLHKKISCFIGRLYDIKHGIFFLHNILCPTQRNMFALIIHFFVVIVRKRILSGLANFY